MKRLALYAAPFLLLAVVWSCAGDGSDPDYADFLAGDGGGGSPACPPTDCEEVAGAPTLTQLQATVFTVCGVLCHNPDGDGSAMLLDTADHTYESLVCVDSDCTIPDCNPGGERVQRVLPCESDLSYLYWKLVGPPEFSIEGDRMPAPPYTGTLQQSQIDAVRDWIEAGAQR